ncbi:MULTISPECIES: hypothetical protein [Pseudomonas]|uniref:hypothetical protein n=1 Tax=Pseudomonas TaxID=286 RepID=UPI00257EA040|nr:MULTISPECIES: hypothetical protein [Pseudomonas]
MVRAASRGECGICRRSDQYCKGFIVSGKRFHVRSWMVTMERTDDGMSSGK